MIPITPPYTPPQPATCPHCGAPMKASTPAADAPPLPAPAKDANVAHEPPPSGWRERPKLL
jgi:hypothetical protein